MSTARHSPRFPRVPCVHGGPSLSSSVAATKKKVPSLLLLFLSFFPFLSSDCLSSLFSLASLFLSIFLPPSDLFSLSLSLFCLVSAHRPRAHPPRLSGKPCCEPLTVTKVPTYKRGLIPARGNSREHGHGNVRQVPRHVHRENCKVKPSAVSTSASPNTPLR